MPVIIRELHVKTTVWNAPSEHDPQPSSTSPIDIQRVVAEAVEQVFERLNERREK